MGGMPPGGGPRMAAGLAPGPGTMVRPPGVVMVIMLDVAAAAWWCPWDGPGRPSPPLSSALICEGGKQVQNE